MREAGPEGRKEGRRSPRRGHECRASPAPGLALPPPVALLSLRGPHTKKGLRLGLMVYCCHLEILSKLWTRGPVFSGTGSTNSAACPRHNRICLRSCWSEEMVSVKRICSLWWTVHECLWRKQGSERQKASVKQGMRTEGSEGNQCTGKEP